MEHAGDRIKENLEYAKGQAKDAFGKVFHEDRQHQADEDMTKGKQQMSSMADEAQSPAQQAKSGVKEAMSK